MANSGDGDNISSQILPNCQRSASVEDKLQSCGFASGLKVSMNDIQSSPSPENDAAIPIVTLSDSSDEYHTPPEHHSHTTDKSDNDLMDVESAHQMFDKMPQREGETLKRKVPVSTKTQGQTSNCFKDITFKDTLNRVNKMVGEVKRGDGDGDFFEIAKKRGMTFPRPRWWPAEGFKD